MHEGSKRVVFRALLKGGMRKAAISRELENHARILRTLGDRLLRIFYAMQRDRTLYDPERTLRKVAA